MRALRILTVATVLAVAVAPDSVHAGWNQWARFFGEYWSNGYHAPGDPWNCPPQTRPPWHRPGHSGYVRPVHYPPVVVPHEGLTEDVSEPSSVRALLETVPE